MVITSFATAHIDNLDKPVLQDMFPAMSSCSLQTVYTDWAASCLIRWTTDSPQLNEILDLVFDMLYTASLRTRMVLCKPVQSDRSSQSRRL